MNKLSLREKAYKDQKGISLLEAIIGSLILAGAAVLLTKGIFLHKDSNKLSKTIPRIVKVNDNLVSSVKSLLRNTKDSNGKRKKGLCQFISTDTVTPGVGLIKLEVFSKNDSTKKFTNEQWEKSFSAWEMTSAGECGEANNWKKCFKLTDPNMFGLLPTELEAMNVYGSIEVIPTNMNPMDPDRDLFTNFDVSTKSIVKDVKDISFKLIARTYYTELVKDKPRKQVVQEDFFWAPSIGECDFILRNGREVILSLSGMGGADPNGVFIYNKSSFLAQQVDPVEVEFVRSQILEGKINPQSQRIVSNSESAISVSCNETKFRCRQGGGQRRFGSMNVAMRIFYNDFNTQAQKSHVSNMRFTPTMAIRKGNDESIIDPNFTQQKTIFDGNDYTFDGKNYVANINNKNRILKIESSHTLQLRMSDANSNGQVNNNLCRNICQPGSNYNNNASSDLSQNYIGMLKYMANDQPYASTSGERVGCVACYMKDCNRLGLSTFGLMEEQPAQPLDAGLPECNLELGSDIINNGAPYPQVNDDSSRCVSAKLDQSENKLVFDIKPCNTRLPVMCFNYGTFLLARDLNRKNNTDDLYRGRYNDSARRCYETGREISDKAELDAYAYKRDGSGNYVLASGGLSIPYNGNSYNFINLAAQGIFLAPQTNEDISLYRKWLSDHSINNNPEFWVALRNDKGHIAAQIPFIQNKSSEDDALIFNARRQLTHEEYKNLNIPASAPSGGQGGGLLLFHHVRYKGAFEASKNQGSGNFKFLCMNRDGSFKKSNTGSSNWSDGVSICRSEGRDFVPPTTPMGWLKAFQEVASFHNDYAFPDPLMKSSGGLNPLWIGYGRDTNNGKFELPKNLFNEGKFKFIRDGLVMPPSPTPDPDGFVPPPPPPPNGVNPNNGESIIAERKLCISDAKMDTVSVGNCTEGNKIRLGQLQNSALLQSLYIRWIRNGSGVSNIRLVF